jgi:hypothetical protein
MSNCKKIEPIVRELLERNGLQAQEHHAVTEYLAMKPEQRAAVEAVLEILRTHNTAGTLKNWKQVFALPGVALILGFMGAGKSALAWEMLEGAHARGKEVYVLGMPKKAQQYTPKWVKHCSTIKNLPKNVWLLVDEAGLRFSNRDSQTDNNKVVKGLCVLSRQRSQNILYLTPMARELEISAVMNCRAIIFRKPSEAHLLWERKEIVPWALEAKDAIAAQINPLKWAYVVDLIDGKRGLLKCRLPSFWSDELSEAWADMDIEELNKIVKRKG